MTRRIRKAVFPVAGLGTRFLPATKLVAKEMLPVVDKPLIQYAVEEAVKAGIESFIFVTGRGKAVLIDHFDHAPELEALLKARGKTDHLEELLGGMPKPGSIFATRQQQALGLGHAVWCARAFVGDEPFAVLLPDDLVMADRPCIGQLIEAWDQVGGNVVAVEEVAPDVTDRYGILDVASQQDRLFTAKGLVEKPALGTAPSTKAIIGRYVLDPVVMTQLGKTAAGAGGEIQLTDAMAATIGTVPFHGVEFEGRRFDCGDKVGFLEANIHFALARSSLRDRVAEVLKGAVRDL